MNFDGIESSINMHEAIPLFSIEKQLVIPAYWSIGHRSHHVWTVQKKVITHLCRYAFHSLEMCQNYRFFRPHLPQLLHHQITAVHGRCSRFHPRNTNFPSTRCRKIHFLLPIIYRRFLFLFNIRTVLLRKININKLVFN